MLTYPFYIRSSTLRLDGGGHPKWGFTEDFRISRTQTLRPNVTISKKVHDYSFYYFTTYDEKEDETVGLGLTRPT